MNIQHFQYVKNKVDTAVSSTNFILRVTTDAIMQLEHVAMLNILMEITTGCKVHFHISDKDDHENGYDMLNNSYEASYNFLQMELAFLNVGKSVAEEDDESDDGVDYFEFYLQCNSAIMDEDTEYYSIITKILENTNDEILKAIAAHVRYLKEYLFVE